MSPAAVLVLRRVPARAALFLVVLWPALAFGQPSPDELAAERAWLAWVARQRGHPDAAVRATADTLLALAREYSVDSAVHRFAGRRTALTRIADPPALAEGYGLAGTLWSHRIGRYAAAREMLAYALAHTPPAATARPDLIDALIRCHYWLFEGEEVLRLALEARDDARARADLRDEWRFTQWAGRALEIQREWTAALRYYEAAGDLALGLDDDAVSFDACLNVAVTLYKSGDAREGLRRLAECRSFVGGDPGRRAVLWLWEGSMRNALGEHAAAGEVLAGALALADSLGLRDRGVHALMESAKAARGLGQHRRAIRQVNEALRRVGDDRTPYNDLFGLEVLYGAHKSLGEYDSALAYLERLQGVRARLDSVNSRNNVQALAARYDAREQAQLIERQRETIARRRWLGVALALASVLLVVALVGLVMINRNRRLLAAKSRTIERQAAELTRNDATKTRFFGNIAHELRTPLTLLLGPLETVLREGQLAERERGLLRSASRGGRDLLQLVNQLLSLFRLEAGQMPVTEEPVRLRPFFEDLVAPFAATARESGLEFAWAYRAGAEAVVRLDADKVSSIVNNLLSNAFKFTPVPGRVSCTLADIGADLELTVVDSGRGIEAHELDRVFDRYYQTPALGGGGGNATGGSGIGLSVVREYAQLLGGSAAVRRGERRGTVFTVRLPRKPAFEELREPLSAPGVAIGGETERTPAPPSAASPDSSPSPDARAAVLVVEDHPGLRAYLEQLLAPTYDVTAARNGRVALDVARAQRVDLVLTDVMMPELDGYGLLERLRADDATRHIPVVMLTARAERDARRRALRLGVDDYLVKPFDARHLSATLAALLAAAPLKEEASTVDPSVAVHASSPPASSLPVPAPVAEHELEWLERFEDYLRAHYRSDVLNVGAIAHELAVSESTLLRRLKRLTGLTPARYLQEMRLTEARRLLDERGARIPVKRVAAEVGYDNARSFSRLFKRRYGILPSEYAQRDGTETAPTEGN